MENDNDSSNETHYTELRKVYVEMIDKREDHKKQGNTARSGELLWAIRQIEDLLNEWDTRDDRDGHPEEHR